MVDAVGPGVEHLHVGDRVWLALAAYQRADGGTAQEFAVLPAERVFPLPENAGFDVGASLGVPAVSPSGLWHPRDSRRSRAASNVARAASKQI